MAPTPSIGTASGVAIVAGIGAAIDLTIGTAAGSARAIGRSTSEGSTPATPIMLGDYFLLSTQYVRPPISFLAAMRALMVADPWLRRAVRGGFWHRKVPPRLPNPCGVFLIPSCTDEDIGGVKFIQTGMFQVSIYSGSSEQARALADRVADVLVDAQGRNITWRNGKLMYLRRNSVASPMPPGAGYGGSNVQGEIRAFNYQFHGSYLN